MQEACLGVGSLSVLGSEAWGISSSKGFVVIQLFIQQQSNAQLAQAAWSCGAVSRLLSGFVGLKIKRHYICKLAI
jgi:hypothetical protein